MCLPPLALALAWAFHLPPEMAMGLFILAVCPGGITSNAITYAARANVALAVVLTSLSSLITVFTIPILVKWALGFYFAGGDAPTMSAGKTMLQLAEMTALPVLAGGGRWEEATGVRLTRAEDDAGRPVTAAHRDAAEPEVRAAEWVVLGGGLASAGRQPVRGDRLVEAAQLGVGVGEVVVHVPLARHVAGLPHRAQRRQVGVHGVPQPRAED